MQNLSNPTRPSGQAPRRVSIGGQLLIHWLQGNLQIGPPSKRKRESSNGERHANGNGATTYSDGEVKSFVIEAGIGRVQRVIEELTEPALPLQPATGAQREGPDGKDLLRAQ